MAQRFALPTLTLVAVLAGCVSAPTTGGIAPSVGGGGASSAGGAAPSGAGLGSDLAVSAGGAAGAAAGTAGANTSVGISINAPGSGVGGVGQGSAVVGQGGGVLLDPKTPGYVSAKAGGVVTGPNGLQATIPPGALSRDAIVKLTPKSTAELALTKNYVPGIVFGLDLGGASLAPGTQMMVSAPVDGRFVAEMQKRDAAFKPEAYGLKQDAAGTWMMSMPVKGAHVGAVAPSLGLLANPNGRALLETGGLALPAAAPAMRRLFDSTAADCATWVETIKVPVPTTMGEWRTLENANTFSCAVYDGTDWFMNIFYDLKDKKAPCGGTPPSPGSSPTPVAPVQAVPVPAHVSFVSDDPALNGKDAAGALIHFDFPWTPSNGPNEVQADVAGKAASSTLAGMEVALTALVRDPDMRGESVRAEVQAGMAPVELKLPMFSPKFTFEIESEVPLSAKTLVSYKLGDQEGSLELATPEGSKSAKVEASLHIPAGSQPTFSVTAVSGPANSGAKPPLPEPFAIRHNGQYNVKLSLILLEAR